MNPVETQYGIPREVWKAIISTIRNNAKVCAITLIGSRAKGTYKNGSDIDLALSGALLNFHDILGISSALDTLDLPWEIDLINIETLTDEAVRDHIERCGIVIG